MNSMIRSVQCRWKCREVLRSPDLAHGAGLFIQFLESPETNRRNASRSSSAFEVLERIEQI